jgi:pimeloyl-ACP methyl ester carboxylesterase
MDTVLLRHNAIDLALHRLRPGQGRPLLLLHGLGEQTPGEPPGFTAPWPGPVWGLDFTGHGASTVPRGGGYSAEVLMGDADAALTHLGPSTVVGRGLGAYVALLIAGARPHLVRGVALTDGPGIAGGGVGPTSTALVSVDHDAVAPPDPWALVELARDVRPPDYATAFARSATQLSGLDEPIAVCARWRPAWLAAVAGEYGVAECALEEALAQFAGNESS